MILRDARGSAFRSSSALLLFALTGCPAEKKPDASPPSEKPGAHRSSKLPAPATVASSAAAPSTSSSAPAASRAAPPHVAPTGTLFDKPFAPDVVVLEETSDGARLGFYQRNGDTKKRERWRCEATLGGTEREMTANRSAELWKAGSSMDIPIDDWSITGVSWGIKTPGKAKVTIDRKDAEHFTVEGTIALASTDGKSVFTGKFSGEYCPSKVVARESPPPLLGMAWTLDAVSPDKVSKSPLEATIAGTPGVIKHVTIRERKRLDKVVTQLAFFREMPPDPCSPRPAGGWTTSYDDDGRISSREGAKFRIDSFGIDLAAAPKAGSKLQGRASTAKSETNDIVNTELQAFEPDGYRSWTYSQYFSAALVFDEVDDAGAQGRVYLALPDSGKSQLVGSFRAKRCPALE